MAMYWSNDLPEIPGFYWWRPCSEVNEVNIRLWQVRLVEGKLFAENGWLVNRVGGQWAGPIPIPEEKN